jgi:Spy/CpxP family protein refolding chaperone
MRRAPILRAVTLFLTTILVAATAAYAAEPPTGAHHRSWESRLQQKLGLRDDQVQAIRQIHQSQAETRKQHGQALRQAQAELRRLVLSEADQPSIEAKQAEVQQLIAQSVAMRVKTLQQIVPLLTPEQRQKYAEMMEKGGHVRHHRRPQQS